MVEKTKKINKSVLIKWSIVGLILIGSIIALYLYLNTTFTVSFLTGGGSTVGIQQVKRGQCVIKPENPTRDGYKFVNWTYNGSTYAFSKKVDKDIVLIAKWQEVIKAKYIKFTEKDYMVAKGETIDFDYELLPAESNEDLSSTVQFDTIAEIDVNKKRIKGLDVGITEIYISCGDVISVANLTVLPGIEHIVLSNESYSLYIGDSLQLQIQTLPEGCYGALTYKTSDEKIASVDENGKVIGIEEGKCTITIKASSGIEQSVAVEVKYSGAEKVVISVDEVYLDLNTYPEYQLNVIVSAGKNADKKLTYESSDNDVASVDSNGNITAKGIGSCRIKASTANGLSDSVIVYVDHTADEILFNKGEYSIDEGDSLDLCKEIIFKPSEAKTAYHIEWYASDNNVTINEQGVVTGVKASASATAITAVFTNYSDEFNRIIYVYCNGGEIVAYNLKDTISANGAMVVSGNNLMLKRYESGEVVTKDVAFDNNCKLVSSHDLLQLNLGKIVVSDAADREMNETFHFEYGNYRSADYSVKVIPSLSVSLTDSENCSIEKTGENTYTISCDETTGRFTVSANCSCSFSDTLNQILNVVTTTGNQQQLTFDFSNHQSDEASITVTSIDNHKIKIKVILS